MSILSLALKNAVANKKRSLSLAIFILIVTIVSVVCINFIYSIQVKMEKSIYNGLTGDIIIREKSSAANEIYSTNIDALQDISIKEKEASKINEVLGSEFDKSNYTSRIRYNGMISANEKSEVAMIIGMDESYTAYQNSFVLTDGNYLSKDKSNEVILVSALAESLNVKVGDSIVVMSKTVNGKYKNISLKVCGIGNLDGLAIFSLPIMYTNLENAEEIAGYSSGEFTDFIVSTDKKISAAGVEKQLKDTNLDNYAVKNGKAVSGFVLLYMNLFSMIFMLLIGILTCIVGIMVINLAVLNGMQNVIEIGTLRAIGFGRFRITMIYFCEMMITTFISIFIGIIISFITVSSIHFKNITGTMSGLLGNSFNLTFSIGNTLMIVGIIAFILMIFTLIPCWKITKLNPVEAFREGC
jgi:ABC-type lipoprotein release transport system permease subunit